MPGRPRKIRRKRFLEAVTAHHTAPEIASALKTTIPTVYNYFKRWNVPLPGNRKHRTFRATILRKFRGETTVPVLAGMFNVTDAAVRYHMRLYIQRHWSKSSSRTFPKPRNINELKIALQLDRKPELYDDLPRLAQVTHLPIYEVNQYAQRVFSKTTGRSSKAA